MGRKTAVWVFQATNKRNSTEKTWTWLRKRKLNRETESPPITAQKKDSVKGKIDKTQQNKKCRLCGDRDETINHISESHNSAKRMVGWI